MFKYEVSPSNAKIAKITARFFPVNAFKQNNHHSINLDTYREFVITINMKSRIEVRFRVLISPQRVDLGLGFGANYFW